MIVDETGVDETVVDELGINRNSKVRVNSEL